MASIQTTPGGMPVLILKEGTKESKGREAQKNNLTAAKLIAEIVKTSLGPRGMDKMLVDNLGDVTITNDGATILKEIDVQHPAAKMMVEVAKSVDNEVGDGTTSSVVFAGALLEKAEDLLNKDVHPSVIVDGYNAAAEQALKLLEKMAVQVDISDKDMLLKIARTSMDSKLVSDDSPLLGAIVADAAKQVAEKAENGSLRVDLDNIKVEKKAGGSMRDTKLIKGIVLDKEVVHAGMPKRIEGAKIALVNSALEIEKTEMSAEIRISDPHQMQMFLEEENRMLKAMVDKVKSSGANVVLCQKGIDDIAQHYLAKAGVLAVRRVKESDMTKMSRATGARIVNNLDDLTSKDLGSAELVEERKVETDKWVFIEGCKNPKAVTILIRGGSQRVVDEADRSLHDALMVMKDVLEKPAIVAGGGAPEAYIANELRQWSSSQEGRAQLAVQKFADALDAIPLNLAENAGMDPIDTMTELRAKQSKGSKWTGVDARNTVVADMYKQNVLEPLVVKQQIIKSATEVASMILRIDDVIAASKSKMPAMPPGGGGMGGGMGGMGGMGME
ncbi:thermosome subunit beta [Nitrososphaera viennensis]|uniref:Archaeal thermosome n=2 Tax=Nitrososphaera viennensis TaxID=1034015 RepID=A0A060HJE7_9ARCH|nr:thermosome subunit beta [Nitrososphaera viennensis]AIC16689.1 archaeal thermosome [Nitrososphaera viennensis EN76]UVS68610.1 TCP-1/cpn60 chaperonin family protein [Nitrososphaera viennensis]